VTNEVTIWCVTIISLIKWQSSSICFVCLWKTGLLTMYIVT